MKIIGLRIDGIRKLTAIEMEFKDKGLIPIKGRNKQGKTTIIDSVELAIRGNRVANPKLIQNGKDKAEEELILSDYTIKRVISNNGKTPKLEVKNTKTGIRKDGEVQNFLNTLINEVTFNPFPFKNKTAVEKLNFFLDLCKDKLEIKSKELLGYGFAGIDSKLESLEEDRKLKGREVKAFGDLDLLAPEKVERVDISATLSKKTEIEKRNSGIRTDYDNAKQKEIEEINTFNQEQRKKKSLLEKTTDEYNDYSEDEKIDLERITELEKQLISAKNNLEMTRELKAQKKIYLDSLSKPEPEKPFSTLIPTPKYEDTTNEDHLIQNALAINQKAEIYESWLKKKSDKVIKENEYDEFTQKIQALRNQKIEILRSINTGVKGLEICVDGIYYNDVYSENWSDAESLRISAELCLAQMPQLRTVFIDRGESFDSDSLAELDKWATENDVQCITTIVDDIPDELENGVFYIQEGKVFQKEEVEL
jgi:hypothetical protein